MYLHIAPALVLVGRYGTEYLKQVPSDGRGLRFTRIAREPLGRSLERADDGRSAPGERSTQEATVQVRLRMRPDAERGPQLALVRLELVQEHQAAQVLPMQRGDEHPMEAHVRHEQHPTAISPPTVIHL